MHVLNLAIGPLILFVVITSITPGPNNLLLMRSGATFGVRRSLTHLAGVQLGFAGLVLLSYVGVGAMLLALPGVFGLLRWACFAYLLWLAVVILRDARRPPTASAAAVGSPASRPMSLAEAVLFQLINPKAWMMTITIVSAFYGGAAPRPLDLAVAIAICMPIGGLCMLVWTVWGASMDLVLKAPAARSVYGYGMSLTVALTAMWMLR